MPPKIHQLIAAIFTTLLFSCCTGSDIPSRIQQEQATYNSLSSSQKQLVQQGKISKGMPAKAVYIAWGKPTATANGSHSAGPFMRWDYIRYYADYTPDFYYGGYGYHGHNPYWGHPSYYGGRHLNYRPSLRASVEFRNNRVIKWMKSR